MSGTEVGAVCSAVFANLEQVLALRLTVVPAQGSQTGQQTASIRIAADAPGGPAYASIQIVTGPSFVS